MIYSKQDIVRVYGEADTLSKNIGKFCALWKKYCNGINGVTIPNERFLIQINGFHESENVLKITLISSTYEIHERTVWSGGSWSGWRGDSEDEMDLGDVREEHTVYDREEVWKGVHINVPTAWLLTECNLEEILISKAKKHAADAKEAARVAEIKKLEEKLAELKGTK